MVSLLRTLLPIIPLLVTHAQSINIMPPSPLTPPPPPSPPQKISGSTPALKFRWNRSHGSGGWGGGGACQLIIKHVKVEDEAPSSHYLLLLQHMFIAFAHCSYYHRDYVITPLAMYIPLAKSESSGWGGGGGGGWAIENQRII